jgi:CTP:molybdopterin cytidylyltransferase MocA
VSAGILLCAGGSTRFGGARHKLRVGFRGRPLVCWALDHVNASGLDEVIVVTGAVDLCDLLTGEVVVDNPRWASGLATSLDAGVAEAQRRGHDVVVVGLGDQPLVPPTTWSAVAAAPSPIAVASYRGRRAPPVRLAREVWRLLPREGDIGARALMRARPDLVREVPCDAEPFDVDTPEDLARWT